MDSQLDQQIRALSDAEALEAAQLYAFEVGATPDEPLDPAVAEHELLLAPTDHVAELAQLARLLLLTGTANDDPAAARAVAGAGQTQFVLGGAEIVLLAGLLVTAYHVHKTDGKIHDTTVEKTVTKPDGTVEVEVTHEVRYGISGRLLSLLTRVPGDTE